MLATCIQHEINHLDGKLIIDFLSKLKKDILIKKLNDIVDLTPRGIRDHLELHKPIYKGSAAYGHFGRSDIDLTWEKTDKADQISQ